MFGRRTAMLYGLPAYDPYRSCAALSTPAGRAAAPAVPPVERLSVFSTPIVPASR
jgi:hypothetical protein